MPASKGAQTDAAAPSTTEAPAGQAGAPSVPEPATPAAGGVFEYVAPFTTVYHLPLTAHPLVPAVPPVEASGDDPGSPGSPQVPATVFAWPDGPPDDRWAPTRKKPNQAADNAAPLTSTEV